VTIESSHCSDLNSIEIIFNYFIKRFSVTNLMIGLATLWQSPNTPGLTPVVVISSAELTEHMYDIISRYFILVFLVRTTCQQVGTRFFPGERAKKSTEDLVGQRSKFSLRRIHVAVEIATPATLLDE